jgi:hypothetical protein
MMTFTVMGCGGSNQVGEGKLKTPDPRSKHYQKEDEPAEGQAAPAQGETAPEQGEAATK